jgi:ubiquinone/menaquinone biosynthesis C-methylase UbiE
MSLYRRYIFPWLLHQAMKTEEATRHRERIIPAVRGRVLEVGVGSGLNLPFYAREVESLHGIDPSAELLERARKAQRNLSFPVELSQASAEALPFDDARFDSVVTTWTLCSIPEVAKALSEMRRVLKADGAFFFIEHGRSSDPRVEAWQNRLNPLWKLCAGGCNMNRDIENLVRRAGFKITHLETGYLTKGPRLFTFHFDGRATRGA